MKTRVKFCGCTSVDDVMLAVETGADAIGLIFAPSPRRVTFERARVIASELPPVITPVGVFVNPSHEDLRAARSMFPNLAFQLHGEESPEFVASLDGVLIKTIHVDPAAADLPTLEIEAARYPSAILLFDTKFAGAAGGTGKAFPWHAVAPIARRRPVMVSGGLTPENVSTCVQSVRPYAVDVRSGIESDGRKDATKMRTFVQAVKDADAA